MAMFSTITPFALGWIAGTALQLQQLQLWEKEVYLCWVLASLALAFLVFSLVWIGALLQTFAWFALACTLAFSLAGVRASHYLQTRLKPALEGRTLQVVGIVANLPQRTEDSARFRFEVESARQSDGSPVELPFHLLLGWYGNRLNGRTAQAGQNGNVDTVQPPPADLSPGDRWQFARESGA